MQHNICYQQPLLVFKRLMLSTSFHFVPPLQSGIVCLVNFVDVKISVKLPTLFFVLCVLVLHIPSQSPGVSNAAKQAKTQTVVFNFYCSNRIFIGLARMPFFRLRILVGFSERIFEYSFQKKTPSKTTLIILIYSLEPILTVSAYFVEDLIAFER